MAKKILIVDDDENTLKVIAARLKANNYEVVAAVDAIQAVAQAHKEKPDLIILDNRIPAGRGVDLLSTLRKSTVVMATPIILITAYPTEEIKKQARERGAADFIAKPIDGSDLIMRVKRALGE